MDSEILKPTKYIKPRIDEDEAKKRKREIRKLEEMLGLKRPGHLKFGLQKKKIFTEKSEKSKRLTGED